MNRKVERRMMTVMGIWQIIDGLVTILYFGFYKLAPLSGKMGAQVSEQAIQSLNSSMFTLTCTFGSLLIGLGIFNLVTVKRYLKDGQRAKKFGLLFLGQGLFSYFVLDIPSMLIGIVTGVVYFAKNKALKQAGLIKKQVGLEQE
ncbi:hypothetical protein [Enterococcus sp. JM9B]|uniref:hypothetical protein n=1 Tax=Enterococcus sp. JM9B TaxID=1857216 RepID=UPI001374D858|nr:hypothetical protein [Enterococcus sp. JM9B]KAF1302793.1 hypothetical protein BAU16_05865 [Enterococcus sp. JM9B]